MADQRSVQAQARWGDPIERFWSKVAVAGPDECWLWIPTPNWAGYGQIHWDGRSQHAHRISWQIANGPIPAGLDIDHECHNRSDCPAGVCVHRRCVNPAHLRTATRSENIRASNRLYPRHETCSRGHEFDEANTYINPRGGRECRACRYAAVVRHRHRSNAA